MKKLRPIKNTWYDWLINYIPEPIRKSVSAFEDKIVSLLSQLLLNKLSLIKLFIGEDKN